MMSACFPLTTLNVPFLLCDVKLRIRCWQVEAKKAAPFRPCLSADFPSLSPISAKSKILFISWLETTLLVYGYAPYKAPAGPELDILTASEQQRQNAGIGRNDKQHYKTGQCRINGKQKKGYQPFAEQLARERSRRRSQGAWPLRHWETVAKTTYLRLLNADRNTSSRRDCLWKRRSVL